MLIDSIIANGEVFSCAADRFHQEYQNMVMIIKVDTAQASMQRLGAEALGLEDILQCKEVIKQAEGVGVNEVVKNVGDIRLY